MTQKDAVHSTVLSVLSESGVKVDQGTNVAPLLNRELRARINEVLVNGFNSGSIQLDKQFDSDTKLRAYVSGLVSNWVRKDPRLNGGISVVVNTPSAKDPRLKALRQLLAATTDQSKKQEIQSFIDKRIAELKAV